MHEDDLVEGRVKLRTNETDERLARSGVLERQVGWYRIAFSDVAPLVSATLQVNSCDDKMWRIHWTRVDRADAT